MTHEIEFEQKGSWGVVTLNRPQALNALTWPMVEKFRAQLKRWEREASVEAVLIKGTGDKAFCAGGDIRWLADAARKDAGHASGFFREEYRLNAAIHHLTKPYVALIDGIVMGGGVGVSVHGDFRVAGDRTLFAMPETGIGLFPDVGGGYFLPLLHGGVGLYFALTGARAKAADCMAAGVATHYTPTNKMADLEAGLLDLELGALTDDRLEARALVGEARREGGQLGVVLVGQLRLEVLRDQDLRRVREAGDVRRDVREVAPIDLRLGVVGGALQQPRPEREHHVVPRVVRGLHRGLGLHAAHRELGLLALEHRHLVGRLAEVVGQVSGLLQGAEARRGVARLQAEGANGEGIRKLQHGSGGISGQGVRQAMHLG